MKALYFDGDKLEFIKDYPDPSPASGEAVVKVHKAGICSTDLEILKGYMGFTGIPGHEFVGRVVDIDENHENLAGKRVVGEINLKCGRCDFCRRGLGNHCPNRSVLGIYRKDGVFAESITLPVENLHLVPDEVEDDLAVLVEPVAAAIQILKQIEKMDFENVLVMGDGKLGLLCGIVLSSASEKVLLAGKHEKKLKVAEEMNINSIHVDDLSEERKWDLVVDATGRVEGLKAALSLVRPRGTVIVKTTVAEKQAVDFSRVVVDEINIIGSRCGPFEEAIVFILQHNELLKKLISGHYPLNEYKSAFKLAKSPDSLKVLLEIRN